MAHPAQILCDNAGLTMKQVCKKAGLAESTFKSYVSSGAPDYSAQRICWALNYTCDPMIFIWGYRKWKKLREGRDGPPAAGTGNGSRRRQRPENILNNGE